MEHGRLPQGDLYHFRFRDYSPPLGRWTSMDPIRYEAGDVNLYRALGNTSINSTDPMGLEDPSNSAIRNRVYFPSAYRCAMCHGSLDGHFKNIAVGIDRARWNDDLPLEQKQMLLLQATAEPGKAERAVKRVVDGTLLSPLSVGCGVFQSYEEVVIAGVPESVAVPLAPFHMLAKGIQGLGESGSRIVMGEGLVEDYVDIGLVALPLFKGGGGFVRRGALRRFADDAVALSRGKAASGRRLDTGVAAYDQLVAQHVGDKFVLTRKFQQFLRQVEEAGWIVKPTTKLPPDTPAYFFPQKGRFYYNPETMRVIDMIHERVHLEQFIRQGNWKIGQGRIFAYEIEAYSHEYRLGVREGFSQCYIDYLHVQIEWYKMLERTKGNPGPYRWDGHTQTFIFEGPYDRRVKMKPTDDVDQRPATPVDEIISQARRVWAKSQVVYQEPSHQGKPEACYLMEQLVQCYPHCESKLVHLLGDVNQLVVAYALLTLEMLGSSVLCNLPPDLLDRRENLTLALGSFRIGMELGGLARQVQKRARERAARQFGPSS